MGYGCVIGRNDTKAIAMSVLDHALTLSIDSPTSDMEFVLLHGDCSGDERVYLPPEAAPLCDLPVQAGQPAETEKEA